VDELKAIWRKVGGGSVVRQVIREHMVVSTALGAASVGVSRKGLEIVRNAMSLKLTQRFAKLSRPFFDDCREHAEREFALSAVEPTDVVWTLWLQGEEQAPDVVRACLRSAREHLSGKRVVVLTEDNWRDFVELPPWIEEKLASGAITRTHLSDLIRLELLTRFGGMWVDATVFFTGAPPAYVADSDLFLYQLLKPGLDGQSIRTSSWLMTAQAPSKILILARELLFEYWRHYDHMMDYYLIHYCLEAAIDAHPDEWARVVPASNEVPHMLLLRLGDPFDADVFAGICEQTSVHKLSYKLADDVLGDQSNYLNQAVLGQ